MTTAGRAYVVRDADGGSGEVTKVYAYTLKGLTTALEDARFGSFRGTPQTVVVMRDGQSVVIRRFEQGREVPLTPLRPPTDRINASLCAVCGDIHLKHHTMMSHVHNV
jgi:hypothetical protein